MAAPRHTLLAGRRLECLEAVRGREKSMDLEAALISLWKIGIGRWKMAVSRWKNWTPANMGLQPTNLGVEPAKCRIWPRNIKQFAGDCPMNIDRKPIGFPKQNHTLLQRSKKWHKQGWNQLKAIRCMANVVSDLLIDTLQKGQCLAQDLHLYQLLSVGLPRRCIWWTVGFQDIDIYQIWKWTIKI